MKNNKDRTAIWLYPDTMERMDGWLTKDNCKSRSEFVEKALSFYMGYLASEDTSSYLSKALLAGVAAANPMPIQPISGTQRHSPDFMRQKAKILGSTHSTASAGCY